MPCPNKDMSDVHLHSYTFRWLQCEWRAKVNYCFKTVCCCVFGVCWWCGDGAFVLCISTVFCQRQAFFSE